MQFFLLLSLVVVCPLAAQISGLATTDDGAVSYLSSPLRLRGTEQLSHEKIFRGQGKDFHLFAQIEREEILGGLTNFFRLLNPALSGDGSVVGYVGTRDCVGGSRCVDVEFYLSSVVLPGVEEPIVLAGRVQFSRNGRYAVQFGSTTHDRQVKRIDLVTGDEIGIPPGIDVAAGRQAVTSDGRITLASVTGLSLWSPEETTPIPIQGDHLGGAIINDQGSWVVYTSFLPPELHSIELASGTDTLLAEGAVNFYQQSVSNDGSLVLYVAPAAASDTKGHADAEPEKNQAFVINSDGTERRQLTNVPEGVSEAILSGDGNVAYAATHHGRLLRIDVGAGTTEELIPRTPFITAIEGGAAPGSLSFMQGTGLSETVAVADTPLPESLGGVEVRLGDTPARMLLVAPHDVRFQIPFEIGLGDLPVGISSPDSPFEQTPVLLPVKSQSPRFIRSGSEVVVPGVEDSHSIIVNLDFSELITPDNPARPNDIVTLYMTGLGATEPAVATGEFTPIGPLSLPTTPIGCVWQAPREQRPIETFFAGLAPALIGVYQVTVRLPPDPPPFTTDPSRSIVSLHCGVPGAQTDNVSVPVQLDSLAN